MIVVRNVFRLKFGRAKEAIELWKEGLTLAKRVGFTAKSRVLTDVVGQFYTLVFENQFESLSDFENSSKKMMSNSEWQAWYQKIQGLIESGHREILNVVAEQ
jgi:hypothetical protein